MSDRFEFRAAEISAFAARIGEAFREVADAASDPAVEPKPPTLATLIFDPSATEIDDLVAAASGRRGVGVSDGDALF